MILRRSSHRTLTHESHKANRVPIRLPVKVPTRLSPPELLLSRTLSLGDLCYMGAVLSACGSGFEKAGSRFRA